MKPEQAIELLLHQMNRPRNVNAAFFGAMDGSVGNINILQRDMNAAITTWREQKDPSGLQQLAGTLHVMGNLTEAEYEQIMKALDGVK